MMKKNIYSSFLFLLLTLSALAQSGKTIRIGYIDMEYILQKVSNYTDANNQLEQKAQKWRQDLEGKNNEITKLKESLKIEKVLLTKELIEEREEAIVFLETEMGTYQQNRFGPQGDFMIQKDLLVKPIQDQIFIAVQDIAEKRKYDFILDKSSDLTILFARKNFDISDQVVRIIERADKVEQRTKKQIKADEAREYKEDVEEANPLIAERRQKQTERQEALNAKKEERLLAQAKVKAAAEEKRLQIIADREAKKNGVLAKKVEPKADNSVLDPNANATAAQEAIDKIKTDKEAARKTLIDAKAKDLEMRKKAIEDKKAKTLADREALKKTRDSIQANTPKK